MANLYYMLSQGNVIFENGLTYEYAGQVIGTPNDAGADIANISAYTYNDPDAQGKTIYTAVQRSVSAYENGNIADGGVSVGTSYQTLFTASFSGVLRIFATGNCALRIDSVYQQDVFTSSAEAGSFPFNVYSGSLIEVRGVYTTVTAYYSYLPFVYP